MKDIEDIKREYKYFAAMKDLEIIERQRENKESKFFLRNKDKYYTLCCDTQQENKDLLSKLEILKKIFGKDIPKVLFCEPNNNYIVTEYIGNGDGISFFDLKEEDLSKIEIYADKIKQKLDILHSYPIENQKNWYEEIYQEFYQHSEKLKQLQLLTKEECNIVMNFLEQNKSYLKNVKPTYIHGDLTARNCCLNLKNQEIYFIDFDMFQIGDPFIDIQKIIWTKRQSKVFTKYVEKYCMNYDEDIYLLYWLKIKFFWLPFAYNNKVDYTNSLKETINLIAQAQERIKRKNVRKKY